jgi:glyoxylase-like metal-dependent hydrolase (beta-lactamase superfamily II)
MEIHSILDSGFSCNIFIVESGGQAAVIDTGTGQRNTAEEIAKFIELDAISKIILTHRHCDHIGGIRHLKERLPDVEYLAYKGDAEAIQNAEKASTGSAMWRIPIVPVKVTWLDDGDVIEVGKEKLEVMHTPGHTIGSMCLYHRKSKTLFSGDTVFSDGFVGRTDLPTGSITDLRHSLKLLSGLGVENLYAGHEQVVEGEASQHIKWGLSSLC